MPVIWVGLPAQRGAKVTQDVQYLNDLYKSRAEKAGIVYVDIWDGFVDEAGRFAAKGPDYEGQIRRLRTGDGVYFTKFGARKLAHYVEREIQRNIVNRAVPVALPPVEPGALRLPSPAVRRQRPPVGPVLPLTATPNVASEELLGGARAPARAPTVDPVATRVLIEGRGDPAPTGRADDFSWPPKPVSVDSSALAATPPSPAVAGQAKPGSAAPAGQAGADETKPAAQKKRRASYPRAAGRVQSARILRRPVPLTQQPARGADFLQVTGFRCATRLSAAASSRPSGTCRRRARPGGLRGSPTPPATGRAACRRRRTPSGSSSDRRRCRP